MANSVLLTSALRALIVLVAAVLLLGSSAPARAAGAPATQKTVVIPVQGMVCFACASTVKAALKSLAGVSRVEVSIEKRSAQVTYAPDTLSPDRLVTAISKAGYTPGTPEEVK